VANCSRRVFSSLLNSTISASSCASRSPSWEILAELCARGVLRCRMPRCFDVAAEEMRVARLFRPRLPRQNLHQRRLAAHQRCSAECTASKSSNAYIRSARVRSSPGVCGPRSNKYTAPQSHAGGNCKARSAGARIWRRANRTRGARHRLVRKRAQSLPHASSSSVITGSRFDF